ncbi:hypothetical protein EDD21DRAFT_376712 [Dissophora ornata]|nr:hypothetical protein EDD21DRAFT_376712 [Dissophora ornata]
MTNPLKLPELRRLVGGYLATRDILVCILVCRAWYNDFKPLLYQSITLDEATLRLLPRETLQKHAHLFRHIAMMEPMRMTMASLAAWIEMSISASTSHSTLVTPSCTISSSYKHYMKRAIDLRSDSSCNNLRSLDINPSMGFRKRVHEVVPKDKISTVGTDQYDIENDDFWCLQSVDACIQLIRMNRSLRSLTESWDNMSSFHRIRFANQLCRLRNDIVDMHLANWEVTPDEFNMLIENSPRLEMLRFSKLTIKNSTGAAVGPKAERGPQHSAVLDPMAFQIPAVSSAEAGPAPPLTVSVINLQRLKILVVTHASFQLEELHIDAPELNTINISFSQVSFKRFDAYPTPNSFMGMHTPKPQNYHRHHRDPSVIWNTPKLEKLICNRTDRHVATSSLYLVPHSLRIVSFADYEIESRILMDAVTAQGLQLESIRLACFSGITARDVRVILTRCPNLVNFYAPEIMIWAGDLVPVVGRTEGTDTDRASQAEAEAQKEEWVCRRLEKLSVYMCLESSAVEESSEPQDNPFQLHHPSTTASLAFGEGTAKRDQQQEPNLLLQQDRFQFGKPDYNTRVRDAFQNQLAKLTRLRHLDLSGDHVEKVGHVQLGLPWTVDTGIDSLSSLKDLEHVAVTGWIDDMGSREIEWMKRSWPKLKRISMLKTGSLGKTRLQCLLTHAWPELDVQDKERNIACNPSQYFY